MMKFKFSLLLIIALVFIIPFGVKADMGSPEMRPVEMVVTNPEGIDYYSDSEFKELKGRLNKDQVFKILYEYNNTYHIILANDDGSYATTYENSYYVKDIYGSAAIKTSELNPTKVSDDFIKKYDTSHEALVYAVHGVSLRKGPSTLYDDITTIKKGTKLEYTYYIATFATTHIYVEYNGQKGWVEILNQGVLLKNETNEYIAATDVEMTCGKIPKNTILKPEYLTDFWSTSAMFNYNGCNDMLGIYKSTELLPVDRYYANAKADLDVYEYINNDGKKLTTISNGSKFVLASELAFPGDTEAKLYVEYNGVSGWVKAPFESFEKTDEKAEAPKVVEETTTEKKVKPKKEKKTKTSPDNFVLMCVVVGGSVALAALIIIILIHKKRKKKKQVKIQEINKEFNELKDESNHNE